MVGNNNNNSTIIRDMQVINSLEREERLLRTYLSEHF